MSNQDSDIELDIITAAAAAVCCKKSKKRKPRRFYINDFLRGRGIKGRHARDFQDLLDNPVQFRKNFRMSPEAFFQLHGLLETVVQPKLHSRPDSFSSELKLALTLEFLASGDIFRHLASVYRVSPQRVGMIVESTCHAIVSSLQDRVMMKFSKEEWINVANEYNVRWNFPNCLGAVDGKHVAIKCPPKAGSLFYNYKGFHSIVLMAVADAEYRFVYYDVGAYGSEGDSSVFRESDFGKKLFNENLNFPPHAKIMGSEVPFFLLGDDAFPLHKRIMKPFAPANRSGLTQEQRIFNYRLSRARRCVENTFGILCSRWICLARSLFVNPTRAQKIVTACCLLHNYLMNTDKDVYCPAGFADKLTPDGGLIEGAWRDNVPDGSAYNNALVNQNNGRPSVSAKECRDLLSLYVNSVEGSVHWQNNMI